jgi:hypothetical protein
MSGMGRWACRRLQPRRTPSTSPDGSSSGLPATGETRPDNGYERSCCGLLRVGEPVESTIRSVNPIRDSVNESGPSVNAISRSSAAFRRPSRVVEKGTERVLEDLPGRGGDVIGHIEMIGRPLGFQVGHLAGEVGEVNPFAARYCSSKSPPSSLLDQRTRRSCLPNRSMTSWPLVGVGARVPSAADRSAPDARYSL